MDQEMEKFYISILEEELVPAMGCTEPIAIAYCAALTKKTLGEEPVSVHVDASANIIKNVKSVVVPNTGNMHGIQAAAAAGFAAGNPDAELEVLSQIQPEQIPSIKEFLENINITLSRSENPYALDITVIATGRNHTASVQIAGYHTNVIKIVKDKEVLFEKEYTETENIYTTDHSRMSVAEIVQFADEVDLEKVRPIIERQVACNTEIANEGLQNSWGANIGKILLRSYGNSVNNRAKAYAAAGSDARMSGCKLPVVINSGSGNQGLTASLPVIVYAKELGVSEDCMYRALLVSNLITIHLKTGIGRLSAYCGATSAGCGAGAGVTYLYGGKYKEIAHTIVNAIAIDSGMICDGAKPSCAAKIASAVEAGLLGMQMMMHDSEFVGGDGIVVKGVENTIRNVGVIAKEGMKETDREIIKLMIDSIEM